LENVAQNWLKLG